MAVFKKDRTPSPRRSLIASAVDVPLSRINWNNPRPQAPWQREAYRFLDIIGELRYIVGEFGSAVARTRLYLAEVDESGDIVGETEDAKALAIFGKGIGSGRRSQEEMQILGMNICAAGEAYLVGLAGSAGDPDRWVGVSVNDIIRSGGRVFVDLGEGKRELVPGVDILTRVWRPHPNKRAQADSAVRSSRTILRLIELLMQYLFAQIDSRLKSGGILPWPEGTTPIGSEGTVAEDLMSKMVEIAAESARGRGTAANVVPLVVEVPESVLGKIGLVNMGTELSKQAKDLLEMAVSKLAMSLDISPEELTGLGQANHWSSWQLKQSTVDSQVAPIVACICDAIQRSWMGPALEAAGLDPNKYVVWFDTSTLTVRPQRLKDTLDLYTQGLVNAQAVLDAGAYLESEGISPEDDVRRFIRDLILRDPTQFNNHAMRVLAGVTDDMLPKGLKFEEPAATTEISTAATPAAAPPVPDQTTGKHVLPDVPATQGKQPRDQTSPSLTSSADPGGELGRMITDAATFTLADATVQRAMELAGGRLLGPRQRGEFTQTPRHELHTVAPVPEHRITELLKGAGEHTRDLAARHQIPRVDQFCTTVAEYCVTLLRQRQAHSPERLRVVLQLAGLIGDPDAS